MPDATYFSAISIKLIVQEMTLKLKPTCKKLKHMMCIGVFMFIELLPGDMVLKLNLTTK